MRIVLLLCVNNYLDMYYLFLSMLVAVAFLFFYKIIMPLNEPDFKLKGRLTPERLNFAVRELAVHSRNIKPRGKGLSLKQIKRYIVRCYKHIAIRIRLGAEVHSFENWLYDNYYKIHEEILRLKSEINKFYFLPHVGELPRVYELSQLIVKACDGHLCAEILKSAIDEYNSETPLTYAEIMALKPAFIFSLLEYIAIFCSKSLVIERKALQAKNDLKNDKIDLNAINFNSYIHAVYESSNDKIKHSIASLCRDNGVEIFERLNNFNVLTSSYNGRVSSAVVSLHNIHKICNDENILSFSPVHELLSDEPEILYNTLSMPTKYSYLYYIHSSAKKRKIGELALAREKIENSKKEKRDVSHFILPPPKNKNFAYIFALANLAFTIGLSSIIAIFFKDFFIAVLLISLPISFVFSGMITAAFCKSVFKRRKLPSVDLQHTDKSKCRTLITVSRLIGNEKEIDDAFLNLETVVCANPDKIFSYCLALDLPSSASEGLSEKDESIVNRAKELYEKSEFNNRILVLIRRRKKIKNGEKYQGWEKKRGALIQLNKLLLGNNDDNYYLKLGNIEDTKYVVALDSDTLINNCLSLVALMEHPYNADKTILSISMRTNTTATFATKFSKYFAGSAGLDGYASYFADAEFDIFGSGNYTGKGIYRIKEFDEKLSERFEDNRILSHDYIEGAYSSCANSGQTALDAFPHSFSQFLTRQVRWIRGDYQLLPYLKCKVKNSKGEKTKNTIAPINKWHIFTNMIYPLVPISSMLLLFLSLFMSAPAYICLLAFSLQIVHLFLSIRNSVLSSHNIWAGEIVRQVFNIITLPVVAFSYFFAIILTLGRLITKKRLLEWNVFAHSSGRVNYSPSFVAAIIFTASAAVYSLNIFFYILSAVFASGLIVDLIFSKAHKEKKYTDKNLELKLKDIFLKTYEYFNVQCTEENNFLPCDNYQETQDVGYTTRTSPTNIGFMLLAHIGAYEMGIISYEKMNELCKKTITSVEKLPKFMGNLYNWIEVRSLTNVEPRYASSVDSGNFLVCLNLMLPYADDKLKPRVKKLIDETRLDAFFDNKRGLLRIGYNSDTGEYDDNHYDTVGSEANLAYLSAIGDGKIASEAWNNLSKRAIRYGKNTMFISWTGGMFEHLMAPLFYEYRRGTTFDKSQKAVVKSHIRYAKKNSHKIWGISESQYYATDSTGLYQYKAFGVPEISLSNQPPTNVIAPYAGILALPANPKSAAKNLDAMINFGLIGKYGLYESADLEKNKIMRTYMSHHQGMILAAITNYLCDNVLIKKLQTLPQVRASELLLTHCTPLKGTRKTKIPPIAPQQKSKGIVVEGRHKIPYTNFLLSGKYGVVITENGGGYSCFDNIMLTRFADRTDGTKICAEIDNHEYNLTSGKFTLNFDGSIFENCNNLFNSTTEVFTLPTGNGEVRAVEFTNKSDKPLKVRFKTYTEIVMNSKSADISHPAHSNMFVQTHHDPDDNFIYAKRINEYKDLIFSHFIHKTDNDVVKYTTSKHNYYKRGDQRPDFGDVLSPVFSGSFETEIKPKSKIRFSSYYCASYSIEAVKNFVRLSRSPGYLDRLKGSNYALSQILQLGLSHKKTAANILFGSAQSVHSSEFISEYENRPILSLDIKNESSLLRLKSNLEQIKKLYGFLVEFNLVIVYSEKHNYLLQMTEKINSILDDLNFRASMGKNCTITLINSQTHSKEAKFALNNSISKITDFAAIPDHEYIISEPKHKLAKLDEIKPIKPLGIGGYLEDGSYFIDLSENDTPAPWSNIIANESFGIIITESGGGFTYQGNSQQNKLTNFSNDSILDKPSEFVVLGESGHLWSATKKPLPSGGKYYATHSFGYSEFINNYNGILTSQKVFIDRKDETKFYDITLYNDTNEHRTIDVMFAFSPVLGDFSTSTRHVLDIQKDSNRLTIKNLQNKSKLYVNCSKSIQSWTRFLESFTDKEGNISKNANLTDDGSNLFPAIAATVIIEPNSTQNIVFTLGTQSDPVLADSGFILNDAKRYYSNLSDITITDNSQYAHMTKWLPYQVLCSRFFARAGFYQAGGAINFRDQLQDCLALLHIDPHLVRSYIYKCAAHQFEAGDVQHWWHEPAKGVRTTCSDDKLFLPLAVAEYINFTHDFEFIAERVPFLENIKMQENETSVYASAEFTSRSASMLEHCLKAINSSFDFGKDGLVKIHGGDWYEAMNEVGKKGEGTSVWLSMFLYYVLEKFVPFVNNFDDKSKIVDTMQSLKESIEAAFDGEWYLRAYTDDGIKLGSADSTECKIDLLTQGWAALSGACSPQRVDTALTMAEKKLSEQEFGIIKLFDPPFSKTKNVGYITDYPCGVRENGAQYTQAAVWFVMGLIKAGKIDTAWKLFNMINPNSYAASEDDANHYGLEPYVLADDVYSGMHAGRGGWSYYSGSAAWYYKALIEEFLGIKKRGNKLIVEPKLPHSIQMLSLKIKSSFGTFNLQIDNTQTTGEWRAIINNVSYNNNEIQLSKTITGKNVVIKRVR